MSIKGLLGYYSDCFKEDSADFNLRNLQRLNQEDLLIIKGTDEIASGDLHRLPIDPTYGELFQKRVEIYQRERVLLHCSLFVTGKLSTEEDKITVFSPLVFNEAQIESDEYGFYFSVDKSTVTINEELLSLLLPQLDDLPEVDSQNIYEPTYWSKLLEQSPYDINCTESIRFPQLADKGDVTKALRRKAPSLLPISTLAFVERSASSRGVLHELNIIQASQSYSAPLSALLGPDNSKNREITVNHRLVPAVLSDSQKRVLTMGATKTLGAVSGPPGTGKSYTIAAVATEHFTRGESVLIVASSETALDVIAGKLSSDFGLDNLVIRAGQKAFLREFKQYLNDLLAGYYDFAEADNLEASKQQLEATIKDIIKDEKRLNTLCQKAISLGDRTLKLENNSASFWDKLLHKLSTKSINNLEELWQIHQHFDALLQQKESHSTQYIRSAKAKSISALLKKDRKAVKTLNQASRARTSAKQAEYFSQANFSNLLSGFPVWLVSLNSLHKVLPLEREMFDLVIVDEATQCNIASTLPALQRAKRALVVGDQKQLKHFSFLSKSKESAIAEERGVSNVEKALSYRENSVIDLAILSATEQDQIGFLDEHFRSQPELIHFSNSTFYNNKLKVMQHRPCSTDGHIRLVRINGKRTSGGFNVEESEAVLEQVRGLIHQSETTGIARSIGVLSPFSKQVKHLSELIEQHISLEDIKKYNIRVATPYGFQGEERDVMLLSFSVDNASTRAFPYMNKHDVFNVSVTRARHEQFLFVSVDESELPSNNLLKQYLNAIAAFSTKHNASQQPDTFQQSVCEELSSLGVECWKGYEMLGTYIDILARKNGRYVAIDLIGYPGPWADYFELNTYKVIKRAGIDVFPLSYALWHQNKSHCLEALQNLLAGS
ncbi:hypothetical protein EYS14_21270 [Alteromonadaceae bacterium M269]|nr:hypothetical protein EYS14_21270 [Alteromonadaceae bacterium M269]